MPADELPSGAQGLQSLEEEQRSEHAVCSAQGSGAGNGAGDDANGWGDDELAMEIYGQ